jgi:hypothetical protein
MLFEPFDDIEDHEQWISIKDVFDYAERLFTRFPKRIEPG